MNGIEIVSTGYAKIEKTLDNQQLEQMVETSNEWIVSRTGILKRHLSDKSSAFLAIEAAKKATQNQDLSQLALIIVATMTPENNTPSNACLVQKALGLNHQSMMCFDINVACSGYVYALKVAQSLLEENQYGLVIGSEQLSSIVDYQDRNTCILFGDGAAAALIKKNQKLFYSYLDSDGNEEVLFSKRNDYLKMKGQDVFKFAVHALPSATNKALKIANVKSEDLHMIFPHQANVRIIESAAKRIHVPLEKFYMNLQRFGNTSSASVGLALGEALEKGMVKKGDLIALTGFGAGLTYGSIVMKWAY